jgi:hypothetical protein
LKVDLISDDEVELIVVLSPQGRKKKMALMGSEHRKQKISYARIHKLAKKIYEMVATETNPR